MHDATSLCKEEKLKTVSFHRIVHVQEEEEQEHTAGWCGVSDRNHMAPNALELTGSQNCAAAAAAAH